MADWTIRVAQSPIGFGTPYKHNIIVVVDPAGRAVYEINGGPLDANGKIIPFNDRRGPLAYLSGDFPAGAERGAAGTLFYRPDLDQRVVFSGTEQQVRNRIQVADACIDAINAAREKYTLLTGPRGGRDAPATPTFNSNSVNNVLLQCMGIPVNDPAITSQPGFQNPILGQDQIQQIIEQQKSTAPPAGQPPAGNIPIPRPKPEKRGENWDNSSTVTFADLIPSASNTMPQNATPVPGSSALPEHVIDAGNTLRANGYEITPRTMYLTHVLGPQGAVDLMKRTGSTGAPPEVPNADVATGDQMRAWVRALRLGPAAAGIAPLAPAGLSSTPGLAASDAIAPLQLGPNATMAASAPNEDAGTPAYAPVHPIA
jgi:hypothetical protein